MSNPNRQSSPTHFQYLPLYRPYKQRVHSMSQKLLKSFFHHAKNLQSPPGNNPKQTVHLVRKSNKLSSWSSRSPAWRRTSGAKRRVTCRWMRKEKGAKRLKIGTRRVTVKKKLTVVESWIVIGNLTVVGRIRTYWSTPVQWIIAISIHPKNIIQPNWAIKIAWTTPTNNHNTISSH